MGRIVLVNTQIWVLTKTSDTKHLPIFLVVIKEGESSLLFFILDRIHKERNHHGIRKTF